MKEIKWYEIDENTKPSYETDVAKWYLLQKGEHYAVWRWDSKKDELNKRFLLTNIHTSSVVFEDFTIEGIFIKFEACERTYDGEKSA